MLLLRPFALALLLLAGSAACAASDPAAAFQAAWVALPGAERWDLAVSPAFPASWPPPPGAGTSILVRYAFAQRPAPAVADGAEMAGPWAFSEQRPDGTEVVHALAATLVDAGIQGVRPMRADELALAGRGGEVADLLRRPLDGAGETLVRAFHCNWRSRLGVVAALIEPRHPAFTRWLACR